jgi:hypothetical protein
MKIDQIAFHVDDIDASIKLLSDIFGLKDWVFDEVKSIGMVQKAAGATIHQTAQLAFNYELIPGIEFELIHYVQGANFLEDRKGMSLSHLGTHEKITTLDNYPLVQVVKTIKHTNLYLNKIGRKYKYRIFDTYDDLGFYIKEITRIGGNKSADDILTESAETYKKRNAEYGDNFLNVGPTMAGLFPEGVTLRNAQDFIRWHLFELIVIKATRYANNFDKGGHLDSIRDMSVYSAMVEAVDASRSDRTDSSE